MFKPRVRRWIAPLVAVAFLAAGCSSGLPDSSKKPAEALKTRIATVQTDVDAAKKSFGQRLQQPDAAFMAGYSDQVEAGWFTTATKAQTTAANLYNTQVVPLVKADKSGDASKVNTLVSQVNTQLDTAEADAKIPAQRIGDVIKTKANAATVSKAATDLATALDGRDTDLSAAADQAAKKHPTSAASITKHLTEAHGWRTSSDAALAAMSSTLASSTPNYATVLDSSTTIQSAAKSSVDKTPALLTALTDLDTSSVETLVDMKITCTITVSRSSWDDNSDSDSVSNYTFPVVMSDNSEVCAYWADFDEKNATGDAKFAHVNEDWGSRGDFNVDSGIDRKMWDTLKVDAFQQWPGSDNAGEYYIENVDATYYTKMDTSVDGVTTKGDWQEVDSDEFALLQDSLGMDISERAVGQFADEANYQPSPPGALYVGDTHYGSWQQDTSGNSFWVFYGQYRLFSDLLGGPFYQSDYNRWSTGYRYHQPYYGSLGGQPRWGTKAPGTAARFPASTFISTGGARAKATVRGAGPADRGRGPGGGGK